MEDNKNKKVLNVPTLRFPEFAKNDDWLSLKIYEVCKITTGTFDANAMSNSGKFPFFTCAKEVYRIDKYTFDAEALLVSGNGANVGYIHYCNGKFSAYQRTYVLWDFNINIFFVKYFLEGFLKARISKERRDGNTPYIVLDTLRKFNLYAPKLEEQSKIANFLSLIDKRIELQNKIIKDYELLKKIINIRMFAHSTKLPILRFPEFNGGWEKTTLGNISNIKIYQPQTIKPLNFGKYKVFGANGYIGYYKECNHNTNQVTISCRGEKSGTVNFVEPFVWITGNSMVLNLDKTSEIIKKFLYYELISNNVNYLITGSGQPQLTRDSLIQHKIYFPNIDEQLKIANFLSKLDEVLLNVKCEKEKLIKNKTFLLQNLFI